MKMRPQDFAAMTKAERANLKVGATLCYPQDQIPFVVVHASPTGKVLYVERLLVVDTTTGHKPDHFEGPYPVWTHTYTDQEMDTLRLHKGHRDRLAWSEKRQCYLRAGTPFLVGKAVYHRNYSY